VLPTHSTPALFDEWLRALEARHLADLRVAEVTRALRARSSAYVERRHKVAAGATLDSAGKRAAFALFYGPLHFLTAWQVIHGLGATSAPSAVLDLGCGTGAVGAAWATIGEPRATISGIDRHPWAANEARWTYQQFKLAGQARVADVSRLRGHPGASAIAAAYLLNELEAGARQAVEDQLVEAGGRGAQVLILEPIAQRVTPWWDATASRIVEAGGRADEWRLAIELPPLVRLFDRAAGLRHQTIKVKSLSMNIGRGEP
jgi:hypothetical protein